MVFGNWKRIIAYKLLLTAVNGLAIFDVLKVWMYVCVSTGYEQLSQVPL